MKYKPYDKVLIKAYDGKLVHSAYIGTGRQSNKNIESIILGFKDNYSMPRINVAYIVLISKEIECNNKFTLKTFIDECNFNGDSYNLPADLGTKYDINNTFATWISENDIIGLAKENVAIKRKDIGGDKCKICLNFFQYAGPNMSDNSFVCYNCRSTRSYMIDINVSWIGL